MPERKETFPVISGVGVVVENEQGQILMKKRKDSHGKNEWALPGGKIDFGETFEECALRELKEETNLEGQAAKVISLSNQRQYLDQGIHCVIIGVKVRVSKDSRPQNMEPEKCQELSWFSLNQLPENIFEGSEQIINTLQEEGEKIRYYRKNQSK